MTRLILDVALPSAHARRRFIRSIRGAGLLAVVLVAGCRGSAPPEGAAASAGRGGGGGVPVEVVELATKPVDQVGEFVGTLRSQRSTTIQPQAEGFLTRILVKSGDRVAPGTPMFEIDSSSLRAAVSSLQSVRAAREADAAFAKQQAERAKTLLAVGATSQQEFEQATTQQKTAEAQLKAVDEQIRQQQTELGYFRVTAPTAGIVADIPARQGDRVTRTTVLTTLEDNSGLEVYINVPVQQAPSLKLGLPVHILDESGAVLTTQRISFIDPSVTDTTQTVLVKTPLDPRSGQFRSDQFVRTQIVFNTTPGLTVPIVSAVRINGQYFVFVVESGERGTVVRQRPITVGRVVGNEYVVQSGLAAGDRLVVGGIQKIGDGAPVTPVPPASPAPAAGGAPAGSAAAPAGTNGQAPAAGRSGRAQ
ncbi:MAG: efflux RND transporter periplasmic adaptor subunit [Vicinamibacterales bacterium]